MHSVRRCGSSKKRIPLTLDVKREVETRQGAQLHGVPYKRGECAMCSEVLTKMEFDHIKPLSCGGSNLVTNLQVLCVACHKMKTGEEAGIHRSSWYSECSTDVHESLVEVPKCLQLVFGDGVANCFELDVAVGGGHSKRRNPLYPL